METVSASIAFFAGVVSFLSPCVLPLIPAYVSFLSGLSLEELQHGADYKKVLKKASITSIFFVIGFSIVFVLLGATATVVGKLLQNYTAILTKVAGVLIVALGLNLLGILKINWLYQEKRIHVKNVAPGIFGALIMGFAFAFGWTACVGPILAGILAMAATEKTVLKGMFLLAMYSLGFGIPFILTGFSVGLFMKFFEKYKRFIRFGEIIAGVSLVILGVLMFFNSMDLLLRFVPPAFYKFAK